MDDKQLNNIVEDEKVAYIVDDQVIDDTLCPKCMEKITSDTEFCECGFFVKAAKKSATFSFVFFIIILAIAAGLFLTKSAFIPNIGSEVAGKITDKKITSFASPIIQVQNDLKPFGLNKKIRDIYPQDYKHPNVLIIVIKPEYWPSMKKAEKKYIKKTITKLWKSAYKGEDPQVRFANSAH